jgi:integrase
MRRSTPTEPPLPKVPPGVTRTIKARKTYWYYDPARANLPGKRRRLPELGTLDWFDDLDRIRREQSGESPDVRNVRELVEDIRQTAGWRQLAESTAGSYSAALKPILMHWRHRRPDEITVADVVALMERLAERPAAANMTLTLIRKLMTYAIQKGMRTDNPARDVAKLKEGTDSAKPLTPEAWAALMTPACPVAVHRLAILGRYTGQRISDLIRMRPIDRDEEGISHKIKKLKDRPHWALLTAAQAREIDGWGAVGDGAYITKTNGAPYTDDGLRLVWKAFASTQTGAALRGFTPHDLRATKVCDERIAGKTHQQIAAMVGMSIGKVMYYSKHIDQRLAARGAEPHVKAKSKAIAGEVYLLDEVAMHFRVPAEDIAALARQQRIGAQFGGSLRFDDDDLQALWLAAKQNAPRNTSPETELKNGDQDG